MGGSTPERINFRPCFNPKASSCNGVLVSYLQQGNGVSDGKEMLLQAARAFWMPFAYEESGQFTAEQVRQVALSACDALEQHICYIRQSFNLSVPVTNSGISSAASPNGSSESNSNGGRRSESRKPSAAEAEAIFENI